MNLKKQNIDHMYKSTTQSNVIKITSTNMNLNRASLQHRAM